MTEVLVRKSLEEGLRLDGRPLFNPVSIAGRKPVIHFDRYGTVEVRYGQTIALCVVTGEVIVPPKDRQNEGKIGFHVEYGPLASPDFPVGKPLPQATVASNLIERILKGSRAIDTEALCIVGGQKVWSIRCDIRAINDDGNLLDACAVAALCGILHFRKEAVITTGVDTEVMKQEDREPVPLSVHHMPVPVSFALFPGEDGEKFVLDPNLEEEKHMEGLMCVCVNQHGDLCGLHKPGGLPVSLETVQNCAGIAVERAKLITKIVQEAIQKDAVVKSAAKRDVHNKYNKSDLLNVEGAAMGLTGGGVVQPPPGLGAGGIGFGTSAAADVDLMEEDAEPDYEFAPAARNGDSAPSSPKKTESAAPVNPFLAGTTVASPSQTSKSPSAKKADKAKAKRVLQAAAPSVQAGAAAEDDDDLMDCVKVKKAKKAKKSKH